MESTNQSGTAAPTRYDTVSRNKGRFLVAQSAERGASIADMTREELSDESGAAQAAAGTRSSRWRLSCASCQPQAAPRSSTVRRTEARGGRRAAKTCPGFVPIFTRCLPLLAPGVLAQTFTFPTSSNPGWGFPDGETECSSNDAGYPYAGCLQYDPRTTWAGGSNKRFAWTWNSGAEPCPAPSNCVLCGAFAGTGPSGGTYYYTDTSHCESHFGNNIRLGKNAQQRFALKCAYAKSP
jgi:hypothetical protein